MGWCQTEREERPSTPGGGFRSGQSEPVPASARPSGGWVRRGTAPPGTVWAQTQLHCSVSLLLKSCPGLRLRAREGCAHHRDAGSCRAQPPASPGLLQSWVCGNIQASSRGLASPDVPEPPTPATLPLPDSHCFVTPLFTSYIFTQMWFRVFFPRHILHGRMLSVRWGPNCQIMVAKTCYFGFKLVQSRRHFPFLVKEKKQKQKQEPSSAAQGPAKTRGWGLCGPSSSLWGWPHSSQPLSQGGRGDGPWRSGRLRSGARRRCRAG